MIPISLESNKTFFYRRNDKNIPSSIELITISMTSCSSNYLKTINSNDNIVEFIHNDFKTINLYSYIYEHNGKNWDVKKINKKKFLNLHICYHDTRVNSWIMNLLLCDIKDTPVYVLKEKKIYINTLDNKVNQLNKYEFKNCSMNNFNVNYAYKKVEYNKFINKNVFIFFQLLDGDKLLGEILYVANISDSKNYTNNYFIQIIQSIANTNGDFKLSLRLMKKINIFYNIFKYYINSEIRKN